MRFDELRDVESCFPQLLVIINICLSCVDGIIAFIAFSQLLRIHSRNSQVGWTRQKVSGHSLILSQYRVPFSLQKGKDNGNTTSHPGSYDKIAHFYGNVFHLIIGLSNTGYLVYFVVTVVATCEGWVCWSHSCGFFFMEAVSQLLIFCFCSLPRYSVPFCVPSTFIFLFPPEQWKGNALISACTKVDLCHQAKDDEEDEECSSQEVLLQQTWSKPSSSSTDGHIGCCPCQPIHLGSRQKIVVLVTIVVFVIMVVSAVLIWIGTGKNFVDSEVVARVYVDLFAIAVFVLGGALACYGLILFLKMSKVRSERASSEMWKVAGLAVVSLLCFTLNALIAFFTDVPMLYHWDPYQIDGVYAAVMLTLYYFIGSSIPSASLLWVMRELPPVAANTQEDLRTITFFASIAVTGDHPRRWTMATSSQNQISKASPI
ncbi:THH1/TOM1/TOM3 domain [Dillenia turbinata]|uniref:THH1/TOM1/TOM3 domain n=1 Tax=Dillenia turbinata TaxID=194707 RepID=A0AAN8UUW1_9MAGN